MKHEAEENLLVFGKSPVAGYVHFVGSQRTHFGSPRIRGQQLIRIGTEGWRYFRFTWHFRCCQCCSTSSVAVFFLSSDFLQLSLPGRLLDGLVVRELGSHVDSDHFS